MYYTYYTYYKASKTPPYKNSGVLTRTENKKPQRETRSDKSSTQRRARGRSDRKRGKGDSKKVEAGAVRTEILRRNGFGKRSAV